MEGECGDVLLIWARAGKMQLLVLVLGRAAGVPPSLAETRQDSAHRACGGCSRPLLSPWGFFAVYLSCFL